MTKNDNQKNESQQLMLTTNQNQQESQTEQEPPENMTSTEQKNESKIQSKLAKFSQELRYQQTEKEKELFKRLAIILSTLAIAVFIKLYFISPLSKVGKIVVVGVQDSNVEEIVEASGLRVNKSLWEQYFDKKASSANIVKQNPRVKTAKISLQKMNQLQISVNEYSTIGYVTKDKVNYEVLANGKFLKSDNHEKEKGLPLLINFEEGENLQEFIEAYQQMDKKITSQIVNIESMDTKTNPFRIKLKMSDGNEVIGLSTTIADKMAFYEKITAEMSEQGVIDMEAGTSGVFSHPFETEESSQNEETSQPE